MHDDMVEEVRASQHDEPINAREYTYGEEMLNNTKDLLTQFYRPHLGNLCQLLGENKWMWGH